MSSTQPLPVILIAEDDPNDLELLERALLGAGAPQPFKAFGNGADVIHFLRELCATAAGDEVPLPRLLLLDLHIPQVDGCGVVAWIRKQKALASLRVVVISGSGDSKDVQRAEVLGADRLLLKPVPEAALAAEIRRLDEPSPSA